MISKLDLEAILKTNMVEPSLVIYDYGHGMMDRHSRATPAPCLILQGWDHVVGVPCNPPASTRHQLMLEVDRKLLEWRGPWLRRGSRTLSRRSRYMYYSIVLIM